MNEKCFVLFSGWQFPVNRQICIIIIVQLIIARGAYDQTNKPVCTTDHEPKILELNRLVGLDLFQLFGSLYDI